MALSSAVSRNTYVADGTLATYSYNFKIFSNSDLLVTTMDLTGVQTTLVLNSDYTVVGAGVTAGGTITLLAGNLTSGYTLTIRRVRPITQDQDFRNQDEFFPENHEDAFDKATMVDQQLGDELGRAVQLPESILPSIFNPTLPTNISAVPGAPLVVNDAGTGFKTGSSSSTTDTTRVSKTGDTMTGDLTIANQRGVKFEDATNAHLIYVKGPSSIAANRNVTMPDPGADDTIAMLAATQALSNKAISASSASLTTLATIKTDLATTGTNNDISTTGISYLKYTGASAATYTGFANGADGKILRIENGGTSVLTIAHQNTGSIAANRITTPTTGSYLLGPDACAEFIYDVTASRWKLIASSATIAAPAFTPASLSATYVVLDTDSVSHIYYTTSTSVLTLTLPLAANNPGRIINVKKVDSAVGSVTVTAGGSDTIDGATTAILSSQYSSIKVQSNGTNWFILDLYADPSTYSDSYASKFGLKEYVHGTTYNGGIAPTVTSSVSGMSINRAVFYPYTDQGGDWFIRFNIDFSYSANSHSLANISINGITFANVGANGTACSMVQGNSSTNTIVYAVAAKNAAFIQYQLSAAQSGLVASITGWSRVSAKPTWSF